MSDTILGVIIVAIFLAFCVGAGFVLYKIKNLRFAKAWAPLAPLIGGTVHGDGGGGASSSLLGSYQGHAVRAEMAPNRTWGGSAGDSSGGHTYNYFQVALLNLSGAHPWKLAYHTKVLGVGREGWAIETDDDALRERLANRGAVELVGPLGWPALPAGLAPLEYNARSRALLYRCNAGPNWLPSPAHVETILATMHALAALNAELNAA